MKKILLLTAGHITLVLGVVGIFLPILPTTPFLLLSAACFMKSSKKLYHWLINHKILGLYIRSYIQYKAITRKSKIISISFLWVVISTSALFFMTLLWMRIMMLCIAIGVTIHLLHMKTLTKEMLEKIYIPEL